MAVARLRALKGADPLWGPVGRERAPDDPRNGNRAPVAAVVALAAIVAHHEDVAARHADRLRETARAAAPASFCERLARALAIAHGVSADDRDRLATHGHHTLDERLRILVRNSTAARPLGAVAAAS